MTHSLSMTRHSTPFSSAMILADLTSSLKTHFTPLIKTQQFKAACSAGAGVRFRVKG